MTNRENGAYGPESHHPLRGVPSPLRGEGSAAGSERDLAELGEGCDGTYAPGDRKAAGRLRLPS